MTGYDINLSVTTAPNITINLRRRKHKHRDYLYGLIKFMLSRSLCGLAFLWRYPGEGMVVRPVVGIVWQWYESVFSARHIMFCVAGKWRRFPKERYSWQ